MGRSKKVIVLLAVLLIFNSIAIYAAEDVNQLKNEQKGVDKNKEKKRTKINKLEKDQKNLSTDIEALDKKVNETGDQLSKVEKELVDINGNIKKTTKELKEAEEKLAEKKETFNSRLRVMYKNGSVGYIEVLFSSANIRDFLTKKDMVQAVVDHDVDLLEYMKEQRKIIDSKKKELQTQKASAETTKKKIETKKDELVVATRSKQTVMKKVEKDKSEVAKELDELEQESKQIAAEISRQQKATVASVSSNTNDNTNGNTNGNTNDNTNGNTNDNTNTNTSNNAGGNKGGNTGGNVSVPSGGGAMLRPCGGAVTSPYGPRWGRIHSGIDIGVGVGTPIVAAKDGVVIIAQTGYGGGYGNYLVVDHGGGISTLYAHNSSLSVGVGTRVNRGQTIALSGNSGRSTGPHLHFEVRVNGNHVNPIPYL